VGIPGKLFAGGTCQTWTKRLGSLNASGRSNAPFTTLKIAVFAPIPSASVITAMAVNPGLFRSWRIA
jgi:hypothetical protein